MQSGSFVGFVSLLGYLTTDLLSAGVCMCLIAVPDAPRSVEVVSSLPTEILVSVEAPHEDGGMAVTGYRVEFEDQAQDFDVGQSLTSILL